VRLQLAFETTTATLEELGRKFGCTKGYISRKASELGWKRGGNAERVRAKAEAKVQAAEARKAKVEAATDGGDRHHRADHGRRHPRAAQRPAAHDGLATACSRSWRSRRTWPPRPRPPRSGKKVVPLSDRIDDLRKLGNTVDVLVKLERNVFGITPDTPIDPSQAHRGGDRQRHGGRQGEVRPDAGHKGAGMSNVAAPSSARWPRPTGRGDLPRARPAAPAAAGRAVRERGAAVGGHRARRRRVGQGLAGTQRPLLPAGAPAAPQGRRRPVAVRALPRGGGQPDGYLDLWAREHYKSTIITFAGIIQEVARDPEITIGIFSFNKATRASSCSRSSRSWRPTRSCRRLSRRLLGQPGEVRAEVVARRRPRRAAQGQPEGSDDRGARPGRRQPTGAHFKLRVYDDVVTLESVTTPEQVNQDHQRVGNLGQPGRARRNGFKRAWHVGTRYSFADTYARSSSAAR
jgi:hypothetical protein